MSGKRAMRPGRTAIAGRNPASEAAAPQRQHGAGHAASRFGAGGAPAGTDGTAPGVISAQKARAVHGLIGESRGRRLPEPTPARQDTDADAAGTAARIHTDAAAAAAADLLEAEAFTLGCDIFFAADAYAPGSVRGDALILHELRHVGQSLGADPGDDPSSAPPPVRPSGRPNTLTVAPTDHPLERAAHLSTPNAATPPPAGLILRMPAHLPPTAGGQRLGRWLTPQRSDEKWTDIVDLLEEKDFTGIDTADRWNRNAGELMSDALTEPVTAVRDFADSRLNYSILPQVINDFQSDLATLIKDEFDADEYYDFEEFQAEIEAVCSAYNNLVHLYLYEQGHPDAVSPYRLPIDQWFQSRADVFREAAVQSSYAGSMRSVLSALAAETDAVAAQDPDGPVQTARALIGELFENGISADDLGAVDSLYGTIMNSLDRNTVETHHVGYGGWRIDAMHDEFVLGYLAEALLNVEVDLTAASDFERLAEFREKVGDEIAFYLATVYSEAFGQQTESHILRLKTLLDEYGSQELVRVFFLYVWFADEEEEVEEEAAPEAVAPEPQPVEPSQVEILPDPPPAEPVVEEEVCEGEVVDSSAIADWLRLRAEDYNAFYGRWGDADGLLCANGPYNPTIGTVEVADNLGTMTDEADRFLRRLNQQIRAARGRANAIAQTRADQHGDFCPIEPDDEAEPRVEPDYVEVLGAHYEFHSLFRNALDRLSANYDTEAAIDGLVELMLQEFEDLALYQLSLKDAVLLWRRLDSGGVADYLRDVDADQYGPLLDEIQSYAEDEILWPDWPEYLALYGSGSVIDSSVMRMSGIADHVEVEIRLDTLEGLQRTVFESVPGAVAAFHAHRAQQTPPPGPRDFIRRGDIWENFLRPMLPSGWQEFQSDIEQATDSALLQVNRDRLDELTREAVELSDSGDTVASAGMIGRMRRLRDSIRRSLPQSELQGSPGDADPLRQRIMGANLDDELVSAIEQQNLSHAFRLLNIYMMAQSAMSDASGDPRGPGMIVRQVNLLRIGLEESSSKTLNASYQALDFISLYEDVQDPEWREALVANSMLGLYDDYGNFGSAWLMAQEAYAQLDASNQRGALRHILQAERAGGTEERNAVLATLAAELRSLGGTHCLSVARFIYADILGVADLIDPLGMPPEVAEAQTRQNTMDFRMGDQEIVDQYDENRDNAFEKLERGLHPKTEKGLSGQEQAALAAYQEITGDDHWHGVGPEDLSAAFDFIRELGKMAAIMLVTRGLGSRVAGMGAGATSLRTRTLFQALGTTVEIGAFTAAMRTEQTLSTGVYPHTHFLEDFSVNLASVGISRGTQLAYRSLAGIPRTAARIGTRHGLGIFVAEMATTSIASLAHASLSARLHGRSFTDAEAWQVVTSNAAFMTAFQGTHVLGERATQYINRRAVEAELAGRVASNDLAGLQREIAAQDAAIRAASTEMLNKTTDEERSQVLADQLDAMRRKLRILQRSNNPEVGMLAESYRLGVEAHATAVTRARLHIRINAEPVAGTQSFTYSRTATSERALSAHLEESGADYVIRQGYHGRTYEVTMPDGRVVRYRPRRIAAGGAARRGAYTPIGRVEGNELPAGDPAPMMEVIVTDSLRHPQIPGTGDNVFTVGEDAFAIQITIRPVEQFSADRVTHDPGPATYRIEYNRTTGMLEAHIEVLTDTSNDHIVRGVNHEMNEILRTVEVIRTETGDDFTRISGDLTGAELRRIVDREAAAGLLRRGTRGDNVTADDLATMRSIGFLGQRLAEINDQINAPETPLADLDLLYTRRDVLLRDFNMLWREAGLPTDSAAMDGIVQQFADAGVALTRTTLGYLQGLRFTQAGDPMLDSPLTMLDLQIMFAALQNANPNLFGGITFLDFLDYYHDAVARRAKADYDRVIAGGGTVAEALDAQITTIFNLIGGTSIPSARGRVFEGLSIEQWNTNPTLVNMHGRMYGIDRNNYPTYDAVTVMGAPDGFTMQEAMYTPRGGGTPYRRLELRLPNGRLIFAAWRNASRQLQTWSRAGHEVQMWSMKARGGLDSFDVFRAGGFTASARRRGRMFLSEEGTAALDRRVDHYNAEVARLQALGANTPGHAEYGRYRLTLWRQRMLARAQQRGETGGSNRAIDAMLSVTRAAGLDPNNVEVQ